MAAQTNFIDIATIWLHAGKGGDGAVSFHREKFVAAGGPDGGDGGRGGDIIFVVDDHLTTLMDFRYKRKYTADEGGKGGASLCHGKNAENLIIKVPLGTVIKDAESGLVIADLSDHTPVTIARGGRGGYGNAHFATPTRQIPKFAKPGMPGEDIQVTLELKLIADVGLIGFPNVGKSTLISTISAAKPKIANYHFTTLVPTLGVVSVGEGASFVCADIPGLIEGASEGIGLGHDFLRHVERCRLLLHVVDVPMGEFAIGTNTTAYCMARKYDIAAKLPILIAEKTGPHFAVGDTCYSHAEDNAVFNPDGKEIVARDNEVSLQRKEDMSKAYLNCHTDITIPYDELGAITVIRADGSTEDIIRDGRFVVPGSEALNQPLDEM